MNADSPNIYDKFVSRKIAVGNKCHGFFTVFRIEAGKVAFRFHDKITDIRIPANPVFFGQIGQRHVMDTEMS